MNKKKAFRSGLYQVLCLILGLVVISPIIYCVLVSFMEPSEILTKDLHIMPNYIYLVNYIKAVSYTHLAVLPSRLKTELADLAACITAGRDIRADEVLSKHADWVDEFMPEYAKKGIAVTEENVDEILRTEVGNVFARVLEDAGVYKCDEKGREAFGRFLASVGFKQV